VPPATATAPSVLLITLDTTRADKLGVYGNKSGLTPSLDGLSSRCTLFEHCYAPIPQTFPSHLTVFSGWDPDHHGVRKNLEVFVPPKVPLLAEAFENHGYATGAFVSAMVLLGRFGMGRGFGTYDTDFYDPTHPLVNERMAGETCSHALRWIQEQKGPWFCWVHLYDPHFPYTPPPPYNERYKKKPYDGEVAYMDSALGGFFARLNEAGLLQDTLIVICGDHGESLGEHGEDTHTIFLYDATTRVPFLVHLPGQREARRVKETVGLVDIAPTVRDLCGLDSAPACDGVSLRPLLEGRPWSERPVYIESLEALFSFGWAPLYARVEGHYKFILAPRPELYDVAQDPTELNNICSKQPERARLMKEALQARLKAAQPAQGEKVQINSEEMKSLQSLGYISGTAGASVATYRDPKDCTEIMELYMKGTDLSQAEKWDDAAAVFETILKKDPRNPLGLFCLARCYQKSDPGKAISLYKRSLSIRPDFPQAYDGLITLLLVLGQPQEAFLVGKAALKEIADLDGVVHVLTAWAALKAGRSATETRAIIDSAAHGGRNDHVLLEDEAALALREGDKETALKKLNAFAAMAPAADVAALDKEPLFSGLKEEPRFWVLVLKARQEASGH
jgi:arylsulfatase A-like enzyme